jgi:hypothetical protein
MSAMISATANGEKDWREECVKPEKDDRIQTAVSSQYVSSGAKICRLSYFKMSFNFSFSSYYPGRNSNKGPRIRGLLFKERTPYGNF